MSPWTDPIPLRTEALTQVPAAQGGLAHLHITEEPGTPEEAAGPPQLGSVRLSVVATQALRPTVSISETSLGPRGGRKKTGTLAISVIANVISRKLAHRGGPCMQREVIAKAGSCGERLAEIEAGLAYLKT